MMSCSLPGKATKSTRKSPAADCLSPMRSKPNKRSRDGADDESARGRDRNRGAPGRGGCPLRFRLDRQPHARATEGNLNNDIGLPLTLLRLRGNHRAAVVELGVNHPGETATLAAIASPTVALINNAQREHQEFMKGVAEVAREHGTVFAAL